MTSPTPTGKAATMNADKLRAFGFNSERQRHHDNARRALEHAKRHVDSLLAAWDNGPSPSLSYDARQLNASAAELWAETQAFLALHDVRFVVESDPAEETDR